MPRLVWLVPALALLAAGAAMLGFVSQGEGERAPAIVGSARVTEPGAARAETIDANGITVTLEGGDADRGVLEIAFAFTRAPLEPTLLLLEPTAVTWDGRPVDFEDIVSGATPHARFVVPEWSEGTHALRIARFGQAPAVDASGRTSSAEAKWIDGPWELAVQLAAPPPARAARAIDVQPSSSSSASVSVLSASASGDGREWTIQLQRRAGEMKFVASPAYLELGNGDLVTPRTSTDDGSVTTVVFGLPEGTSAAALRVLGSITPADRDDTFVLRRAPGGWLPSDPALSVVEDAELFGLSVTLPDTQVFSAFGEPRLTDDLGNAYVLDWYSVGFSKLRETEPYRISSGTSAARFIGPIDPRATSLTLTGGPGGQLVDGDSVRFELSLSPEE